MLQREHANYPIFSVLTVSLLLTDGGEGAEEEEGTRRGGEGRGGDVELMEEQVEFPEERRTSVLATKLAEPFPRLVLAGRLFFGAVLDSWPYIRRYKINAVKMQTKD